MLVGTVSNSSRYPVLTGASHPVIVARWNGVKKRLPRRCGIMREYAHLCIHVTYMQHIMCKHHSTMRINAPYCLFKAVMRLVIYDQFCKPQPSKAMHIWTIEKHQPQLELDWPERIAQKQGESTVQTSSPAFVSQTNNCNDCMFGAFHCLPHV